MGITVRVQYFVQVTEPSEQTEDALFSCVVSINTPSTGTSEQQIRNCREETSRNTQTHIIIILELGSKDSIPTRVTKS